MVQGGDAMKSKKISIYITIIIVLIIASIVLILYFATDIFKPTNRLFWKYLGKECESIKSILDDKQIMQNEFKRNNTYESSGNLSLKLEQGENSSKQLDIFTTARHDANSGRTYADVALKNGDLEIFKTSYINSGDIYAIKCDEVTPTYVGIKNNGLQKLAKDYNISNYSIIPDSVDIEAIINCFELTDEEKKHIQETYLPIIINNIPDSQYNKSKEQIIVNGNEYIDTNSYSLKVSGETIKKILIECFNNLKVDNETLTMLSNLFSNLKLGTDYTEISNLNMKIQTFIEKIQSLEFNDNFEILIYEARGKVIKTEFRFPGNFNIKHENLENKQYVSLEILNETSETVKNNASNDNANGMIDLSEYIGENDPAKTIINISRVKEENNSKSVIEIIPDTRRTERKAVIEIQRSNIQNNSFNNKYNIVIKNKENSTLNISYNSNTAKANEVEEIIELTDSNSAIINNYDAKQFRTFAKNWYDIFTDKLRAKLEMLGFEV